MTLHQLIKEIHRRRNPADKYAPVLTWEEMELLLGHLPAVAPVTAPTPVREARFAWYNDQRYKRIKHYDGSYSFWRDASPGSTGDDWVKVTDETACRIVAAHIIAENNEEDTDE